MAIGLANIVASGTIIVPNGQSALNIGTAATSTTYAWASKPDVYSNTTSTSTGVFYPNHVMNPGVFTAGTAPEGTVTRTTLDSNS